MKGHIPVEIPTKRYIKAYLCKRFGEKPLIAQTTAIGSKFYDLLEHRTNERKTQFSTSYPVKVRLLINYHAFSHKGGHLNETNITSFNRYVEKEIKERFRFMMDTLLLVLPSIDGNLPQIRRELGIDEESWSDDSMRKDYYRYRINEGRPLLYSKPGVESAGRCGDLVNF